MPEDTSEKKLKKVTIVHQHPLHVPVSKKNPTGITTRHQHPRRIYESLDASAIKEIAKNYDKKKIIYPSAHCLDFKDSDKYDDLIAIWCDYFNQKFPVKSPEATLDPNVFKALIASESEFRLDPSGNKVAIGIAQITKPTLKALQDPNGEAQDFIFKGIRQKDLKDPEIAIPLAARWIMRKRETAISKLGRSPTSEELILEYKGLLKSRSDFHDNALKKFRKNYAKLIKK